VTSNAAGVSGQNLSALKNASNQAGNFEEISGQLISCRQVITPQWHVSYGLATEDL